MRSLVTGGTGFIGKHLIGKLNNPVAVGRNTDRLRKIPGINDAYLWNPGTHLDPSAFNDVDTIFHLAGESVYKGRWNDAKKARIMNSRVDGTRLLVESLARIDDPPSTLVCASAIGYYGDRGNDLLSESEPPGKDFLSQVCVAWEDEAAKAESHGIRVVQIRTGVVLGSDGGALPQMLTPFRFGAGGKIGPGSQYMSWVHIEDLVNIMVYSATNKSVLGPVNAVAPEPVTNSEFTSTLAGKLHRPAFFHVPGGLLKLTMGEFADALLGSQRVIPEKITKAGYTFTYPDLSKALNDLLS